MASKIKVDQLETVDGTGNITVNQPLSGSGAGLTSLPAGNLTGNVSTALLSGIVPAANLGTGTASSSTFLNGSGAYSEAGGGLHNLLATTTVSSGVSSVDFTTAMTGYDNYVVHWTKVTTSTASDTLYVRVGTGAGPSWQTANTYKYTYMRHNAGGSIWNNSNQLTATGFQIIENMGGTAVGQATGSVHIIHPASSAYEFSIYGTGMNNSDYVVNMNNYAGEWPSTTIVTGIRFYEYNNHDITAGIFRLYGY